MAKLQIDIIGVNTELKKTLKETKGLLSDFSSSFNAKPLTEYQAGLLKIKQAALDIVKQKEADRKAQKSINDEIKAQAKAQKEANAEANKKKPTQVSNSQAEINAYKKATSGSTAYTSALNAERVARAKANAEAAKQAIANNSLNTGISANTTAINQQTQATNQNVLSKKQLAQALAEEKLKQANATAELKNNAREMLNAKGSIEQRRAALARLTLEYGRLSKAERESAAGMRMSSIISGLTNQIKNLKPSTGTSFFGSIKGEAVAAAAGLLTLTAAFAGLSKVIHTNIEISDSLTDVQRTAKLTTSEVDALAKEFKGLDTRTSLAGLLDVGFIGGRLGVAKKDLFGFTKTVDELAVVLKKELPGGAEAVAESLGKIASVYKIVQNEGIPLEQALRKIGSAFLDLSHTGPVTVKYMQDFTLGVAGSAASAKLSLPVIAAYGAVMSEAGIIASSAAISFTRLVGELSTKRFKYFAIAQLADSTLTIEKFTHLINTDTKSALDVFFKGLKAGNPTQVEFTERVKSLGFTTGKVTNAIKALAENQEKLAEKVKVGSASYKEATSITHNFELANNNLSASVDKLFNSISNLTTNPNSNLGKFFKGIVDKSNFAITAISDFGNAFDKTQAQIDNQIISDASGKPSLNNFLFGSSFTNKKQLNEALNRRRQRGTSALQDTLEGQGSSRADIISSGKSEVEIRKLLTIETYKQIEAQKRLNYTLAYIKDPKNVLGPLDAQRSKVNKLRTDLVRQDAVVKRLKSKLPNRATIVGEGINEDSSNDGSSRTITDIENDIKRVTELKKPLDVASKQYKDYVKQIIAFKKELKEAKGITTGSNGSSVNKITSSDILAKSTSSSAIAEEDGVDKLLEKLKQRYIGYYDDLDKLTLKKGANRSKIEADRAKIKENEIRERSAIELNEVQRVESERQRILDSAGVKAAESIQKDLLAIESRYKQEIEKAKGNQLLLSAISEAAETERSAVFDKYAQKRAEAEQRIFDKINEVTEKGFTENLKHTVKGSQRIDEQLKDRLQKLRSYFDELRKMTVDPLMGIGLGVAQNEIGKQITSQADQAKNPQKTAAQIKEETEGVLTGALQSFGSDFVSILRNINQEADKSFGAIIGNMAESLGSQLDNIFGTQLKGILDDLVQGNKVSVERAISGIAGIAGNLISGLSKPTSGVGQGIGGALKGAATGAGAAIGVGAALGTAAGPLGIAIGAGIGGLVGLLGGIFGAKKARKEEARRQAELEEQKKQTKLLERANALAYSASIIGQQTNQGIVTGVERNAQGNLVATIAGKDILITMQRAQKDQARGIL